MDKETQKVILDVPYYSQYLDISNKDWQSRACGIVCLKMVIDKYKKTDKSLIDLIDEGLSRSGFSSSGWIHDVLVNIANDFGLNAFRKEYKNNNEKEQESIIEDAIKEKIEFLKNDNPVIVSVIKNFSEKDKFHLIVLTGFKISKNEMEGFYYHDPDSFEKNAGKHKFVSIDIFKKYWRKMSIYVKI